MSLAGQHALVSGGSTGIGLAIARSLADAGATVTIASRNIERLEAVAAEHRGIEAVQLDVADADAVSDRMSAIAPVDILVNNAGIVSTAPFERSTLDEFERIMAVNLYGTFLCTQAVLPGMRERNRGRIVNVASTAALKGYAYVSMYTASKHAVLGMTRALALELADTPITANCVCPGFTDTPMADGAIDHLTGRTGRSEDEVLAELVKHNPQKRLIDPSEVAATVLWLCSEDSRSINGQAIAVAGGEIM
ncbi:MAG: SDR family NAD(P)-dependent oxidoreductase [Pseudomonadota bacterium]